MTTSGIALRHERTLLGVATAACGAPGSPFRAEESQLGHPMLADTGLTATTDFGEFGFNTAGGLFNGMASAFEVDVRDGAGVVGCPVDCGGCPGLPPIPTSTLPAGLTLLARATGVRPAEITYYPHPGGGHVVSIGSITAGGSLVVDAELSQIARNALGPPVADVPYLSPGMIALLIACALAVGVFVARPRAGTST